MQRKGGGGRKIQTPHEGNGSHPHVGIGAEHSHSSRADGNQPVASPHVRDSSGDLGQDRGELVNKFITTHPSFERYRRGSSFQVAGLSQFD